MGPLCEGAPPGTPWGYVSHCVTPRHCVHRVCKRRGEPRRQLGLGAGWSLQGANGAVLDWGPRDPPCVQESSLVGGCNLSLETALDLE